MGEGEAKTNTGLNFMQKFVGRVQLLSEKNNVPSGLNGAGNYEEK